MKLIVWGYIAGVASGGNGPSEGPECSGPQSFSASATFSVCGDGTVTLLDRMDMSGECEMKLHRLSAHTGVSVLKPLQTAFEEVNVKADRNSLQICNPSSRDGKLLSEAEFTVSETDPHRITCYRNQILYGEYRQEKPLEHFGKRRLVPGWLTPKDEKLGGSASKAKRICAGIIERQIKVAGSVPTPNSPFAALAKENLWTGPCTDLEAGRNDMYTICNDQQLIRISGDNGAAKITLTKLESLKRILQGPLEHLLNQPLSSPSTSSSSQVSIGINVEDNALYCYDSGQLLASYQSSPLPENGMDMCAKLLHLRNSILSLRVVSDRCGNDPRPIRVPDSDNYYRICPGLVELYNVKPEGELMCSFQVAANTSNRDRVWNDPTIKKLSQKSACELADDLRIDLAYVSSAQFDGEQTYTCMGTGGQLGAFTFPQEKAQLSADRAKKLCLVAVDLRKRLT